MSTASTSPEEAAFLIKIATIMGGIEELRIDDRLVDDRGFDSLGMLEFVVSIESLAGFDDATTGKVIAQFPRLVTVRDGFIYYQQLRSWLSRG
jgi:hypothetical protein